MACLLRYVRALGALYMRLVGTSLDCYKYLEPLYLDYRKLKMLNKLGGEQCLVHNVEHAVSECFVKYTVVVGDTF